MARDSGEFNFSSDRQFAVFRSSLEIPEMWNLYAGFLYSRQQDTATAGVQGLRQKLEHEAQAS